MPVRLCDGIFLILVSNAYLKLDHRKGTRRDRQWAITQFFPVADAIAEAFCIGGVKGLEYANYYKSNALPETHKKLDVAARSELTLPLSLCFIPSWTFFKLEIILFKI
jgi:hypothetical protein